MINFKNLAAAVLIATSTICSVEAIKPQAAEAKTCFDLAGGSICNTYRGEGSHGQIYAMAYYRNDSTKFQADVVCNRRNLVGWRGEKWGMTENQVQYVVTEFCALPN